MATDLVLLLVVAVAPGVDHPPASAAFLNSNAPGAVQYENRRVSWEQSETGPGAATEIPASNIKSGGGVSSRRTHGSRHASNLRLASTHATQNVVPGIETSEFEAGMIPEISGAVGGQDCGCSDCAPRGHHHCSTWGIVGLSCPCHSPGDMTQHVPYYAHPQSYYYFRPYQYFHIADHQREVAYYGGDPKHPYANRLFERVYSRTIDNYETEDQPEPITPLRPLRRR